MNDTFAKDTNKTLKQKQSNAAKKQRPASAVKDATGGPPPPSVARKRKLKQEPATDMMDVATGEIDQSDKAKVVREAMIGVASSPVVVKNDELSKPLVKAEEKVEEEVVMKAAAAVSVAEISRVKSEASDAVVPETVAKAALAASSLDSPAIAITTVFNQPTGQQPVISPEDTVMSDVSDVNSASVGGEKVPVGAAATQAAGRDAVVFKAEAAADPNVDPHNTSDEMPDLMPECEARTASTLAVQSVAMVSNERSEALLPPEEESPPVLTAAVAPTNSELTKSLRKVRLTKKPSTSTVSPISIPTYSPSKLPSLDHPSLDDSDIVAVDRDAPTIEESTIGAPTGGALSEMPIFAAAGADSVAGGEATTPHRLIGTEVFDFTDEEEEEVDIPLSNIDFEALSNSNPVVANSSGLLQISIPPPPPSSAAAATTGDLLMTPRTNVQYIAAAAAYPHHRFEVFILPHTNAGFRSRGFWVEPELRTRGSGCMITGIFAFEIFKD